MEFITLPDNYYDDLSTPDEMLNHALGDRRRARLEQRRKALLQKAKSGDVTKKRAARLKKRSARKRLKTQKIDVRQERRKEIKENPKLALLVPLIPLMTRALARKGINARRMGLEDMAKTFYNKVVVTNTSHYEPVDEYNHLDPITITAVVTAIINFVKKAIENKKAGKPATSSIESMVASDGENIMLTLAKKADPMDIARGDVPVPDPEDDEKFKIPFMAWIVVIIIGIYAIKNK